MKQIYPLVSECMNELESLNIECGKVFEFKVNNRFKKVIGRCDRVPNGFIIELSSYIVQEEVPDESTKEVIHHELLHTCLGCFNHGANWQALAEKVNKAYGYKISRLSSTERLGIQKEAKYVVECGGCHIKRKRDRMCKLIRFPERYTCKLCGCNLYRVS